MTRGAVTHRALTHRALNHRALNRLPPPCVFTGMRGPLGRRTALTLGTVTTALAFCLVWVVLVVPEDALHVSPASALRIPLEGVVVAVLILAAPASTARVVATASGALLGLLADLRIVDAGFRQAMDRSFHPMTDWPLVTSAVDYVTQSAGRLAAAGVVGAALLVAVAVPAVLVTCLVRLAGALRRHRRRSVRPLAALALAWLVCAVVGLEPLAGQPVAARSTVAVAADQVEQLRRDLGDRTSFAAELPLDRLHDTSGEVLLGGLRGKDVVVAFVESYGRTALEDPRISPGIDRVLTVGGRDLATAGFQARSGFLTSPTFGGGSWLAHSTLLSGVRVDNQQRYSALLASDRRTLVADFNGAGWRTVAELPAVRAGWREGSFYGYDAILTGGTLGYRGPSFAWSPMPDQFALSVLQRRELGPAHPVPVMATVVLTSSHNPWAPLPTMVDWDAVGDGAVFGPMPAAGRRPADVWQDHRRVRTEYGRSIEYSLTALVSFLRTYGTDDTVLVILGDHQPAPVVSGSGASRDVPITIVARDPAVLARVSSWGWTAGLNPAPDAAVWPMAAFRDRFLTAFSTAP